jgi:diguanylate cyclase (GGDEF)-like protein/putative nucleotidyltransferase with HDIG domain
MTFFKDKVRPQGEYYLLILIASGVTIAAYCLVATLVSSVSFSWLYFLAAVVFGSLLPVRLSARADSPPWFTITLNDLFIFLVLLLYSPAVAVTVAFLDGLISGALVLRALYRVLFNGARLALSTFVVGHILYAVVGSGPPLAPNANVTLVFADVGFSALLFYGLNFLLIGAAMWLCSGREVFTDSQENRLLAALPPIAGGLTAAAIFVSFGRSEIYAVAVAVATFLLAFAVYTVSRERNRSIRRHVEDLQKLYHATIASMAMAIDAKDQSTHGHVYRVQALALSLSRYLKLDDENELQALSAAALLHDIGKLAVPEYILNKPSPLTEGEMLKLKAHPSVGADILDTVPFSYPVVPFVRHHHEKWDGTGYPAGLKGDEIPLGARILSVADAYDALRSDRPYRPKLAREGALDYLRAERGKSFDPAVVDALLQNVEALEEDIREAEKRTPSGVIQEFEKKRTKEPPRNGQKVFDDIASTYREIQAIYEISEAVGKSLNTADTMNLLTDKIGELISFDACAIFLVNLNQNRVPLSHVVGMHADLLEQVTIRVGEGVSGWVAANNQPLTNVSPAPDFPAHPDLQNAFKTCLSVPLAIDDKVLGVITLYSTSTAGFHHDHVRLMDTIAHHAAAAVNNALMFEETQEDAYTDLLTGLPNLRYFNAFMEQELGRAARIDYPVTLLMMDLECFKDVNDKYGHRVGDRTLAEVGQVLRRQMRRSDMLVRYAGDEFLAVLPGTTREQARQTIDRIQTAVDNFRMPIRNEQFVRVGISVGAASYPEDGQETDALLSLADQNMYSNKITRANRRASSSSGILPFEKR